MPDITLTDLQNLIDSSIRERKTLEFKQDYSLETANEKGEFLADVSSFANASGGDLVFGIKEGVREAAGAAKELTPFLAENIDAEKTKNRESPERRDQSETESGNKVYSRG